MPIQCFVSFWSCLLSTKFNQYAFCIFVVLLMAELLRRVDEQIARAADSAPRQFSRWQ